MSYESDIAFGRIADRAMKQAQAKPAAPEKPTVSKAQAKHQALLEVLTEWRSANAIADRLGVTFVTAMRHLRDLRDQKRVECRIATRGRRRYQEWKAK